MNINRYKYRDKILDGEIISDFFFLIFFFFGLSVFSKMNPFLLCKYDIKLFKNFYFFRFLLNFNNLIVRLFILLTFATRII